MRPSFVGQAPRIRRLAAENRAREVRFTRFLRNERVSVAEMASHAASRTAERVAGREIIVVQDTSELIPWRPASKEPMDMDLSAKAAGPWEGCCCMRRWRSMPAMGCVTGACRCAGLESGQGQGDARRSRGDGGEGSQRWLSRDGSSWRGGYRQRKASR